jgi:hypothetical protein
VPSKGVLDIISLAEVIGLVLKTEAFLFLCICFTNTICLGMHWPLGLGGAEWEIVVMTFIACSAPAIYHAQFKQGNRLLCAGTARVSMPLPDSVFSLLAMLRTVGTSFDPSFCVLYPFPMHIL